ncbi:MFS transporter [Paenibacillus sp. H1-7]|uniref:MFS transporter n=1 Tax=Paenibacillus sp. H1-7 TaxID=2282849 RepID=UPI001EF8D957|nr:MFS transporter [Paenibacillus sp. H1-7]
MSWRQIPASMMSLFKSLPRDALFFLIASFVNATGKAVMWPLTTLYVHNVMGKSYGEAGLIVLYQALCSVLGEFAGGNLYYRIGPKAMISGSFAVSSLCLFAIAGTDSWPLYIALVCLLGFTNGISMPSMNAYVGFRWKEHRRRLYNVMYVCNNFGLSIGAMVGGLLASISFSLTYMLTGTTTLLFAMFLFFFMRERAVPAAEDSGEGHTDGDENKAGLADKAGKGMAPVHLDRSQLLRNVKLYLFLSIGSLFFWLSFTQWSTGVAPYIEEQGMDLKFYSLLWTVNGLVILFGQPLTGWIKRRFAQTIVRQMLVSALFSVSAFSFILFFHELYVYLVIGMILATLGEMMLLPAIPTFFSERTGVHAPFYMGLAGGFANVGRMIGPLMFGHAFDLWGIGSVFFLGTLASLAALVMFYIHANMNKDPDPVPEVKLRTLAQ